MCNETKNTEIGYDNGGKRTDEDLDSITIGSESTQKIKLYFNSKKDTENEVLPRIDMAVAMLSYMKNNLNKHGFGGNKK